VRLRASLWVSLATVLLASPALLVAQFNDTGLIRLVANRVMLPRHPPLPTVRNAGPPAAEPATRGLQPLGLVRNRPEELGQVPDHFIWLRDGLMAAQDPDGQFVFFGDDGHITGRATLPTDFAIGDVAAGASAVRLIDTTGRRQMTITRNLDAAALRSLQALPITPDGTARARSLTRRGPNLVQLREEDRPRAKPLDIRSVTGAALAQAYDIGTGTGETRYVVSEEIAAVAPRLAVRVFVRRYNRAGETTGIVHVPIDDFEVVPHDFIAVTDKGDLRVLAPTASGVKIRVYEFTAPPRGQRKLREEELKSFGRKVRDINVDSQISQTTPQDQIQSAEAVPVEIVLPPPPPITRAAILANARAFLTVNWVFKPDNFARTNVENACDPHQGQIWLRPRHFTRDLVGQTIGPMPYRWGGGDTPQTFLQRVEWGALAGNICTCRDPTLNYCIFADSAGTDCSGFISTAWGIPKRGTSGLLDVADRLKNLSELRPGDAIDWPQHHVRLFVGMAPGPVTAFTVLESSTRYGCEGVCESTYRPSELAGYQLLRYRGVREDAEAKR